MGRPTTLRRIFFARVYAFIYTSPHISVDSDELSYLRRTTSERPSLALIRLSRIATSVPDLMVLVLTFSITVITAPLPRRTPMDDTPARLDFLSPDNRLVPVLACRKRQRFGVGAGIRYAERPG